MLECVNFKSYVDGVTQGFADIRIPKWGVVLNGCPLYMKDGNRWVGMPRKKRELRDGGEKFYPFLAFENPSHYTAFSDQAKKAIDEWIEKNVGNEDEEVPF